MVWKQLTERDCREWNLSAINPHDRHTWRSGVRSAMRAASQLPGRVVKMVDRYASVHLNTIYIFQDISSISALIPWSGGGGIACDTLFFLKYLYISYLSNSILDFAI